MDYYANKRWLAETKKKNEEMVNEMRELTQKKQYELDRQKEENERRNFINIAKNLHHLISTKEIPGVYNTPYLPAELKPQVYNADIEEHLKSIFKSNLRKNNVKFKNNNNNKNVIGSQNSISTMNSNSLRGSKNSAVPEQY